MKIDQGAQAPRLPCPAPSPGTFLFKSEIPQRLGIHTIPKPRTPKVMDLWTPRRHPPTPLRNAPSASQGGRS